MLHCSLYSIIYAITIAELSATTTCNYTAYNYTTYNYEKIFFFFFWKLFLLVQICNVYKFDANSLMLSL